MGEGSEPGPHRSFSRSNPSPNPLPQGRGRSLGLPSFTLERAGDFAMMREPCRGGFPGQYEYGSGMSSDAHGATVPAGHGLHHPYHLVNPSPWPIVGALGGFCTVLGIILAAHFGNYLVLLLGAVLVLGTMFFWWRDVMKESRTPGLHTPVVRLGLRYGMIFFISSRGDVLRRLLLGVTSISRCSRTCRATARRCGRRARSTASIRSMCRS